MPFGSERGSHRDMRIPILERMSFVEHVGKHCLGIGLRPKATPPRGLIEIA